MKFKDIYNLAIELGMEADPRGREGAEKALAAARKNYEKLDDKEKAFFDIDSLTNPYADSRILNGDEEDEVAKMIVGIDIEPAELLLTEALNQRGAGIDLVMSHHPEGRALAALDEVMWLQPGAWANAVCYVMWQRTSWKAVLKKWRSVSAVVIITALSMLRRH